jgi:predicted kinase
VEATQHEVLSFDEMMVRYSGEWILVRATQEDEGWPTHGIVTVHAASQQEMLAEMERHPDPPELAQLPRWSFLAEPGAYINDPKEFWRLFNEWLKSDADDFDESAREISFRPIARRDVTHPTLVIVSGAPGSGKSTLARLLSQELNLPLFSRDHLKETLLDELGAPNRAVSREIGRASYALLFQIAGALLDTSIGAIVESNFRFGLSEPDLRPLIARAPTVLLHCQTSRDETVRRYLRRVANRERHAGHFDEEAAADLVRDLNVGNYEPLDLDVPTLVIDTTDEYSPDLKQIGRFVSLLGRPG